MSTNISDTSSLNESKKSSKTFFATFITTFSAVFIAELGDKTQVATFLLSADTGKPIYVFIAAALALILSSLIGVLLGTYIASKISQSNFNKIAGSLMVLISIFIIFNLFVNYHSI